MPKTETTIPASSNGRTPDFESGNTGSNPEAGANSKTAKEQIRLSIRSSLHEVRNFFVNECSLDSLEAHHDGHPIEKPARAAWDRLHDALNDLDKLKEWTS